MRLRRDASSSRSAIVSIVRAVDRIERREHLVLLYRHALFDIDLEDLAGDLRRHRGHATRDDVTRRVEHGISQTRASAVRFGHDGGNFGRLGRMKNHVPAATIGENNRDADVKERAVPPPALRPSDRCAENPVNLNPEACGVKFLKLIGAFRSGLRESKGNRREHL